MIENPEQVFVGDLVRLLPSGYILSKAELVDKVFPVEKVNGWNADRRYFWFVINRSSLHHRELELVFQT